MCDVDEEAVVAAVDAPSIYDIPKVLHSEGLDAYVVRRLGLPFRDVDWTEWDELLRRVHRPAHEVTVALVGKYIDLPDAYLSVIEALRAGGFANDARVDISVGDVRRLRDPRGRRARARRCRRACCVPGGFGVRGIEGKLGALRYAREHGSPRSASASACSAWSSSTPGTSPACEAANCTEFDPATPYPVIATMEDQREIVAGVGDLGGTMRLGLYPAKLLEGSLVRNLYSEPYVEERHRHRYEVANSYRSDLEDAGIVFSGTSPDGRLVEYVELARDVHPFYVGTQAHPEFRSRPTRPHPLFAGLVAAAIARAEDRTQAAVATIAQS